MKKQRLVYVCLTIPLVSANWVGASKEISGTISQLAIDTRGERLIARVICPPKGCTRTGRDPLRGINIISPTRGALLNNKPLLSWSAVSGATSYSVRLDHSTETLWDVKVENRTEIPYPDDKVPLEPGKDYDLTVETIVDDDKDDKKEGTVRFRLLSQANAQRVQADAGAIANSSLTADEKALKLATLYRDNDLFTEAIEILTGAVKNNSQSVPVYQLLGDLYLEVGLPGLAETPYKKALNFASGDKNAQAEAQVGLGSVNVALQKWEQAVSSLQIARANYENLNNRELATQVAQFLGEVYEKSGNRNKAIYWYQQAKTGYEALGDTERLNNVQERLRTLNQ